MFEFFKKLRRIVKNYAADQKRLMEMEKIIRDRTEFHVDINRKSPNQVIVIGRYGNRDYINIYELDNRGFEGLVDHLKKIDRYARPGRFDTPFPEMEAVIKGEIGAERLWRGSQ